MLHERSRQEQATDKPAPLRILIADDNAMIRRILREFLESEPCWNVCGEAVDGNEALAMALELKPDLLLLDISMPKFGGWQACHSIRKKLPELKILVVSEQDPDVMKTALAAAPVDGFVVKSEIARALKSAIEDAFKDQPRL